MCSTRKKFSPRSEVLAYTYPTLHTGKTWYVDFCAFDPASGKMRRKKYMLDSIPKKADRRAKGAELIETITRKLRSGWSPWVRGDDSRSFTLLSDVLDRYRRALEKIPKKKTRLSYCSHLNVMMEYICQMAFPPRYVYQFDTAFVTDFLDWLYLDRELAGRTRNKYRAWVSSLAGFLIERRYISDNPVEGIRKVPEQPKKRQPLSAEMLSQLRGHLMATDPMYLLACMMEYYTMIRPQELVNIRISDISVREQSVFVSGSFSKNKRDGKVGLNERIIRLMIDVGLFSHPGHHYIFGDGLRPCATRASSQIFRREWIKVRRRLRWPDDYQFYSLKDSGIRDLANAKGIVIARDQARHSDISTTNRYLQGRDMPVHEETKHFDGLL